MSEIYHCTHVEKDGFAIIVYYWPYEWSGPNVPSAAYQWHWFWFSAN